VFFFQLDTVTKNDAQDQAEAGNKDASTDEVQIYPWIKRYGNEMPVKSPIILINTDRSMYLYIDTLSE
jgi:hypothetical protein